MIDFSGCHALGPINRERVKGCHWPKNGSQLYLDFVILAWDFILFYHFFFFPADVQ